jgi:basic membrane protein A and related proteins
VQEGKFKGGADLLFNLKNNGMSVGKINPAVPKAFITEMNSYKQKIIAGTLKVPSAL